MTNRKFDDWYDSLHNAIVNGEGYKATASHLWPDHKLDTAYARLKACVNPEKTDKLDFGQVIEVCRFNDRFDPLYCFCDETHHKRPERSNTESERIEAMKQFTEATQILQKAMRNLNDLGVQTGDVLDFNRGSK